MQLHREGREKDIRDIRAVNHRLGLLERMSADLLANAIKYAPKQTPIVVEGDIRSAHLSSRSMLEVQEIAAQHISLLSG